MSNASDFIIKDGVLKKYVGPGGDVVIPKSVTSIGYSAFGNCENLTSIVIPEGVTSIGDQAFEQCANLTSIVLPKGVTSIGDYAFNGCTKLTSIVIPGGVTSIRIWAFNGCKNMTSIVLPEGVTSIGDYAFNGCTKLTSIVIPKSVTRIGYSAFGNCENLTSIVLPEGVTSIGNRAFNGCKNMTSIVLPEGVTSIGYNAFEQCANLTSIVLPEGVTSIGDQTFEQCANLTRIVLPEGVTNIGWRAFGGCTKLTSIVIPKGVTSIGDQAFEQCANLTSIVLPEGVTNIGWRAFAGCKKLKKITLPVSLGAYLKNFLKDSDGLRIHIADLYALTAKYRPCAALCFAEDGGQPEDSRFESHSKYLIVNAGKLVDLAAKEPALLALLCREKWIKAKDADAFLAAVQQTGNAEAIALMLDYQGTKLTSKEKEKAQAQKQQQEDIVFERTVARMNQKGITGLNFVVAGNLRTFENRNKLKEYIEEKGGKLQSSMSAKTDFLIANNLQSDSKKSRKAAELGIEAITECQFNDIAGRSFVVERGILTKYLGAGGDVVILKDVTSIGENAFSGCENLTSIVIPESVTFIGPEAIKDCKNLTIHAPAGSYAETYAKENNISFVAD